MSRATASRTQQRLHQGPYKAALAPEISTRDPDLSTDLLALAEEASNEISRFDAEVGGEIAPFGAILLRSESAASSEIEDLTASAQAIAEAEIGDTGRRNAAQIVANTRAMEAAVALADRLNADTILAMHRALMESTWPEAAGRWRREQVWIGGGNLGPHNALFVPPHHSRVLPAIEDLVKFIDRDDWPGLAHAAVAHAQFETIHPFPDGNGRTGRALLHAMLRNKKLIRNVTVPISAGLLTDTEAYFGALGKYQSGNPAAIVEQLSHAAFAGIGNGRQLVGDLREIRESWDARIRARRNSATWRVADLLMRRPVINASVLSHDLKIAATNVYRAIEPLVTAGILVEFTDRKRNRAWRTDEILVALDAFAARAGRRRSSR